MAPNEESSMIYRKESESTVCLENNQVTVETGDTVRIETTSNAALLMEIQKLRSELIAITDKIEKNQKDAHQELESKVEEIKKDNKKNLDELSERLQPTEVKTSKMVKSDKCVSLQRINGRLGFYVHCHPIAPSDKWSIRTKLKFKVERKNHDVVIRSSEQCYRKSTAWGYADCIEWEEMKNWCLVDGNLTVEAIVTIIETTGLGKKKIRTFDESEKDVSDVILVVGDTKFYVSKMVSTLSDLL